MNCFTLIVGEACEWIWVVGRLRFADLQEKTRLFSQKSIRELISLFSTLMKNLRCLSCWCWNYSFYTPAAILDFTRSSDIPKSYPSTFDLLKLVRGNKRWLHCLLGELQCFLPSHTFQLISPVISSRCYAVRINRASHILCLHLFMCNYKNGPPWADKWRDYS